MKKRIVTALIAAVCAVSLAVTAAPPVTADAATLLDGSTVQSVPVAGIVAAGTTAQMLVLDTEAGPFHIVMDKNCNFGKTKYLTPGEIVVLDIYAGADQQFHAAAFQLNSINTNGAGSVAVGTAAAAQAKPTPTAPTKGANVTVANTVTARGSVDANSTSDLVYFSLDNNAGTMQIKMDATTDMSNGKVIIPGYKYQIEFYNGGDGYNHAAKVIDLSGNNVGTGYGVSSTTYNVPGTVRRGTIQNTLYLSTSSGNMTIKIDATTDTTACHVLKEGQKVTVVCASGPDGFLHAISIKDGTAKPVAEGSMGDKGMLTGQVTQHVFGTFSNKSTDDVAIMSVNGQDMKLRLDSGSKGSNVPAIDPGWSYSAEIYYGADSYYHIQSFREEAGNYSSGKATVNTGYTQSFTGEIQPETRANKMYLKQSDGSVVQIKLDVATDSTGCRILRDGRKLTANCGLGSDGYWHALSLKAK